MGLGVHADRPRGPCGCGNGRSIIDRPDPRHPKTIPTARADRSNCSLNRSETEEPATLDRLERTLTDGYAYAWRSKPSADRLQRRIVRVAAELERRGPGAADEGARAGLRPTLEQRQHPHRPPRDPHAAARPLERPPLERSLDDSAADCVDRSLDAVLDLQLHQDVRDVVLDRLRADVQLAAIMALSLPFAISLRTSSSRSESSARIVSPPRSKSSVARICCSTFAGNCRGERATRQRRRR